MRGINIAIFLGVLAIWAGHAQATPSRQIHSADQILAANGTHYFVLRDLVDNRGTYYGEFRDQYLVELEFRSNLATRFWLLRSLVLEFEPTARLAGQLTPRDPVVPPNVIAILRDAGAVPLLQLGALLPVQGEAIVDGELRRGDVVLLDQQVLRDKISAALNPVVAGYPRDPSDGFMGSRLDAREIGPRAAAECDLIARSPEFIAADGPYSGYQLECYLDEDGYGWARFLIFLPEEG